jgi:hypothetical protein
MLCVDVDLCVCVNSYKKFIKNRLSDLEYQVTYLLC